jgi:hypothetical protein
MPKSRAAKVTNNSSPTLHEYDADVQTTAVYALAVLTHLASSCDSNCLVAEYSLCSHLTPVGSPSNTKSGLRLPKWLPQQPRRSAMASLRTVHGV